MCSVRSLSPPMPYMIWMGNSPSRASGPLPSRTVMTKAKNETASHSKPIRLSARRMNDVSRTQV